MRKALRASMFVIGLMSVTTAMASMGQTIMVQGHLVKLESKTATIKDEKGAMVVPLAAVDTEHVAVGQWIQVSLSIADFYRLNPAKFAVPTKSK